MFLFQLWHLFEMSVKFSANFYWTSMLTLVLKFNFECCFLLLKQTWAFSKLPDKQKSVCHTMDLHKTIKKYSILPNRNRWNWKYTIHWMTTTSSRVSSITFCFLSCNRKSFRTWFQACCRYNFFSDKKS